MNVLRPLAGSGFDWVEFPGVPVAGDLNRLDNRWHPSGMAKMNMALRYKHAAPMELGNGRGDAVCYRHGAPLALGLWSIRRWCLGGTGMNILRPLAGSGFDWMEFPGVSVAEDLNRPTKDFEEPGAVSQGQGGLRAMVVSLAGHEVQHLPSRRLCQSDSRAFKHEGDGARFFGMAGKPSGRRSVGGSLIALVGVEVARASPPGGSPPENPEEERHDNDNQPGVTDENARVEVVPPRWGFDYDGGLGAINMPRLRRFGCRTWR